MGNDWCFQAFILSPNPFLELQSSSSQELCLVLFLQKPSEQRFAQGPSSFHAPLYFLLFFPPSALLASFFKTICLWLSFFLPLFLEPICCQGSSLYSKSAPDCDLRERKLIFIGLCKCIIRYSPLVILPDHYRYYPHCTDKKTEA